MRKKLICGFLVFSIMLSVFAVPSSAVLTETVIAGGLIAAYMAAVGITVAVDNRTDSELGQWIYDRFQNWADNTGTAITVGNLIAGIAIQNGQIAIQNSISRILSQFMPEMVQVNIAVGNAQINGIDFPLKVYNDQTTNFVYEPNWNFNERITITLNNGETTTGYFALSSRDTLQPFGFSHWNGTYRIQLAPQYTGKKPAQDNKVQLFILNKDGKNLFAATNVPTGYYKVPAQSFATTLVQGGLEGYLDYNVTQITTGNIVEPLPSESLADDEQTLIDIGVPVTSISEAAEKSLAGTLDGTISATYTNTNPVPPVPDTNLSFVKGIHSIWYYVEYLVESAARGMQFFTTILEVIPQEITYLFYGALVLMIFGGVISRLLL